MHVVLWHMKIWRVHSRLLRSEARVWRHWLHHLRRRHHVHLILLMAVHLVRSGAHHHRLRWIWHWLLLLPTAILIVVLMAPTSLILLATSASEISSFKRVFLVGLDDGGGHLSQDHWIDIGEISVVDLMKSFLAELLHFLLILVLQEILLVHDLF